MEGTVARQPAKRSQTRFLGRMIEGATPAEMPGFVPPMLATLRDTVPTRANWLHEIKFDGYRIQAHINQGRAILYTRGGLDWTKRFSPIAQTLLQLPVGRAILDGEVIVDLDGRPNFSALQADLAAGRKDRLTYYVFDLLFLDGFDLRAGPLLERKRVLQALMTEAAVDGPVLVSGHLEGAEGQAMFDQACKMGLEGVVSKRADCPYRSGRGETWLKVKCIQRARFRVVGFTREAAGGVAALHLAKAEGKRLSYAGKVGTGFSRKTAAAVRRLLEQIVVDAPALAGKPRAAKTVWVEPTYFAEVTFRDITADGLLRHSSFQGLYASPKAKDDLTKA